MNRVLIRRASLCLALLSPLLVASCSTSTQVLPTVPAAQQCADCVYFQVKSWIFKPDSAAGMEDVLQSLQSISPSSLNEGDRLRIIPRSHDRAVPGIFSEHGSVDFITETLSVTTTGNPIPFVRGSSAGEFSAVLTPLPFSGKSPLKFISFKLSANLPDIPVNKVFNSGRLQLRNGESLLLIQQLKDKYVVWLVRPDFPNA